MNKGGFNELFKRASKNKTPQIQGMIAEALFLLESSTSRFLNLDNESRLRYLQYMIEYRAFEYQRQTGCKKPSSNVWISIYLAFKEIYEID